jgi:putative DNA-invertase from lambdoid prophage Rac
VIVVAKLDRMFRSAADALTVLEELKAQGVALHMLDLGGDVLGSGVSKLVFTILAAVAENERERIRERIREVKTPPCRAGRLRRRQAAVRLQRGRWPARAERQ